MKAQIFRTFAVLAMLAAAPLELPASTLGMVAEDVFGEGAFAVFDADTNDILGTEFYFAPVTGDVLITPDQKRSFMTGSDSQIFTLELSDFPNGARNAIPISNPGEDLAISPDGKFLIVSDGSRVAPISVVDVATITEISTFSTGADTNSVEVCADGSVLVTSDSNSTVRRLQLSSSGTLAGC